MLLHPYDRRSFLTGLVGKTIATDLLESVPQIGTILWLVDPSSVRWLELPFASMAAALERGQIDAVPASELIAAGFTDG